MKNNPRLQQRLWRLGLPILAGMSLGVADLSADLVTIRVSPDASGSVIVYNAVFNELAVVSSFTGYSANLPAGTNLILVVAAEAPAYYFFNWTQTGGGPIPTLKPYIDVGVPQTIAVPTGATTLTANFNAGTRKRYVLSVIGMGGVQQTNLFLDYPAGSVANYSVTGYAFEASLILNATNGANYLFDRWNGAGIASPTNPSTAWNLNAGDNFAELVMKPQNPAAGQDNFVITSFSGNGRLTWSGPHAGATCSVQWASSPSGPWHGDWASLSGVVVTGGATSVAIPMFFQVVSTPTPAARIAVTSPTNLTSAPISTWLDVPSGLAGSTIHSVLPAYNVESWGKVQFTVTQSGYLYLALNYDYQGSDGAWTAERWLKSDFEAAGWTFVPGSIQRGTGGRLFEICRKLVSVGEAYSLRCNKYEPPYPIEPPAGFILY